MRDEGVTPEQWQRVLDNRGLIGFAIRRYGYGHAFDDAFQDGLFGLIRAAQKFDPDRGVRFSTLAVVHIHQAMQRGRGRAEGANYRSALRAGDEFAAPLSMDMPLTDEGLSLADVLADDREAPEREAITRLHVTAVRATLHRSCRDDFDRAIVASKLGEDPHGRGLAEIAAEFGKSGQTAANRWERLCAHVAETTT